MKRILLCVTGILLSYAYAQAQLTATVTTVDATCNGTATGELIVNANGGVAPYTYVWSTSQTTATISNAAAGTYTVTVTDANANTTTATGIVNQPPPLVAIATANGPTCSTAGAAFVNATGGTAPYTYQWSNGFNFPQVTGLAPGLYLVTVTDGNGCNAIDTVFIQTGTLQIAATVVYDSCAGTACGVATAMGTNASFVWSNGTTTPTTCGLTDGVYSVTATDNFGCTASQTITVANQAVIQLTTSTNAASCGSDGNMEVFISGGNGPYTIAWSNNSTTQQVNNVPAGNYTVTVTDANGCSGSATATVSSGSFTIVSTANNAETCAGASNGSLGIGIAGTNPPFSYNWSNGDTSASISGLSGGVYIVTVTDNGGCTLIQTFVVAVSRLQATISQATAANCSGQGGSLTVATSGGTAPFTYAWSNGINNDTLPNVPVGGYTVTVTDASGCSAITHGFVTTNQSCYTQLSGTVYADIDNDCAYTTSDVGIGGVLVHIMPGYYAYTLPNGNWTAYVPLGNYDITVPNVGNASTLLNTCSIDTVNVNVPDTSGITGILIPKTATVTNDVAVSLYCGVARPGFVQYNNVGITNKGLYPATISGTVVLSPLLTATPIVTPSAGLTIDSITNNPTTIHYSASGLPPQQSLQMSIQVVVPTIPTISLGQVLAHTANVTLLNDTDQVSGNNNYNCSTVIVGSYDPNDKQVFNTDGISIDGPAAVEDTLLHYLIRFQNTGTDTAFTVVVRDTLDEHLNVSTFRFIATSHNVEISFEEERIVVFTFNNILLPDSNVNEPMSHGFIEFDIEVLDKSQLNEVSNQAAIYFDFNPPIYTNTVVTQRTVGISEKVIVPVSIFPNPSTGRVSANLGGLPVDAVEMYDLMGRQVLAQSYAAVLQADFDATPLGAGLYIVRIRSGADWYQERVVIAK